VEKVIITLRAADADEAWCTRLRVQVAADLLEIGAPGLAINVRDDAVRNSLMTLTTLEPPVVGFVTMWTQQSYGDQVRDVGRALQLRAAHVLVDGKELGIVGFRIHLQPPFVQIPAENAGTGLEIGPSE